MPGPADPLRSRLEAWIGQPLSDSGPSIAPDPVNVPMIRHWVDALDDRNPIYLDASAAAGTRWGVTVAPPAMLQTWTMARPRIEGIAERGGAAMELSTDSALGILAAEGYTATVATNSELEFVRYLHVGDRLSSSASLEAISDRKVTSLGVGYFVTWVTDYTDDRGEVVGRQRFRVFRFTTDVSDPAPERTRPAGPRRPASPSKPDDDAPTGEQLPAFVLDVTATVIVAGAIASRDFMPAHHDRDYAQGQGAPDIFMNILTTTGYIARYVTDWAGSAAQVRRIAIRLGAPAVPGSPLHFTGRAARKEVDGADERIEVAVRAVNGLGDHAVGSVDVMLPLSDARLG